MSDDVAVWIVLGLVGFHLVGLGLLVGHGREIILHLFDLNTRLAAIDHTLLAMAQEIPALLQQTQQRPLSPAEGETLLPKERTHDD